MGPDTGSGTVQRICAAILQIAENRMGIGLIGVEVARITIGGVQEGIPDGGLVVGFAMLLIERMVGICRRGRVLTLTRGERWHGDSDDEPGSVSDVRPAWDLQSQGPQNLSRADATNETMETSNHKSIPRIWGREVVPNERRGLERGDAAWSGIELEAPSREGLAKRFSDR